jgi:anthraniloyl-CoA monooxygenase
MALAGSARVAIVGGGPAGLFLARMIGLTQPKIRVDLYERNAHDRAAGFGVALSDRTMNELVLHDPATHERIAAASVGLSAAEVRLPGATLRYDGFNLSSISRDTLLMILRDQALRVGAALHFRREADAEDLDADVVALADGATSTHRNRRSQAYRTSITTGSARYIWLGTTAGFKDVTAFAFVHTEFGPMAAHSYPYAEGMSTVVVEMDDTTWHNAGLDSAVVDPGSAEIAPAALGYLSDVFTEHLDGHPLISNRSKWGRFNVVRNERWFDGNTVLLGDAAHTAHFTVGSGTKLALEDAIGLARSLAEYDDLQAAFAAYQQRRSGPVTRTQRWAEPSMRWWETFGRRLHLPPAQFGMHFITRTVAINYLGLRRRCGDRVDDAEAAYFRQAGMRPGQPAPNAIGAPLELDGIRLAHRMISAPPAAGGAAAPAGPGESFPAGVPLPMAAALVLRPAAAVEDIAVEGITVEDITVEDITVEDITVEGITVEGAGAGRADAGRADAGPTDGSAASAVLLPVGYHPSDTAVTGSAPAFAELRCPAEAEWTAAADELVRRAGDLRERGIAGVLLRPADHHTASAATGWWDEYLRHASRIRTEARMAVAVCVPQDWALDLTRSSSVDAWPTRIHLALISGRIDLVAPVAEISLSGADPAG